MCSLKKNPKGKKKVLIFKATGKGNQLTALADSIVLTYISVWKTH